MKRSFLSLIVIGFTLYGCGGSDVPHNTNQPGVCYVLCDFSESQGSRSRQGIMSNALSIFDKGLRNFRFRYYDIGAPQYEGPFFDYYDSSGITGKKSLRDAIDKRKKLRRDNLQQQMVKLFQQQGTSNTCIIGSLSKVAASLASDSLNRKSRVRVIILSDMLEDCVYDSARIDIDKASFDKAIKAVSKLPKPVFSFNGYNIEVYPVVSSENNISPNKLFEFWKQVFAKYDYELKVLSTDLPR
jgi:hypothetical protein